jgi:3-methylcrotonyl-CoA carboxylase alpha subunit
VSDEKVPQVHALGSGRYELVDGTRRRVAYAVRAQDATWVSLEGRVFVIKAEQSGRRTTGHGDDETALAAPMPAAVVSVHVTPGQTVAGGDILITLEAMKMEMAVKAPRAGVVRAVHCRAGELVQPGVALLELD